MSVFALRPRELRQAPAAGREKTQLTRDDFGEFVTTRPQAALRILAEMGERMRQTNELMSRQVSKNVVEASGALGSVLIGGTLTVST